MAARTDPTVELDFNPADWKVTVGGVAIPWTQIECTFEQFHLPAGFCITAPLEVADLPTLLADKAPEVIITHQGAEFFVGQVDDDSGVVDDGEELDGEPEETISITGRDLSSKLVLSKIVDALPQNKTASELVTSLLADVGLTDTSQITGTSDQVGEFIRHQYSIITQKLNRHDVIFDMAELEHFVFRVHKRTPFFGVQPDPGRTITLQRGVDFGRAEWHKSHTNADVKVRVLSWTNKKKRVIGSAGTGSLIIQLVRRGLTPIQAKNMANRVLEQAERGLQTMHIPNIPGDASVDDILVAFAVKGIADRLDQTYWPRRIHHVITQDAHVYDVDLYNAVRILA